MTDDNKPSIFHVSARRWRDKVNGNTYHSVAVTFPDGFVTTKGMTYGYGTAYEETALQAIAPYAAEARYDNGALRYTLSKWAAENGHKLIIDVVDVTRKRDLHDGGKQ